MIENSTAIYELKPNLNIYPNPASTHLHIESDGPVSLDLMDLQGRILMHTPLSINYNLGVVEFPRGMYLLRISHGAGYEFQRIILY
ncbi:MAG: T9SS type A sorting domain-containing protein [Saprospiraceae bacterium]|nr:T9SS type A sorting domain-containing protein [Saprospiraceae bacterium]